MTRKQESLYWREWAAVRRTDPDADRHEMHVKALGRDKSHKDFSNAEFDRVLGVFRAIHNPASLNSQVRQIRQPKTRFLWKITVEQRACLALFVDDPDAYILAILRDKFRVTDIEDLSEEKQQRLSKKLTAIADSELEMLRNTLARCISKFRQDAGWTVTEMLKLAGITKNEPTPTKNPDPRELALASAVDSPF